MAAKAIDFIRVLKWPPQSLSLQIYTEHKTKLDRFLTGQTLQPQVLSLDFGHSFSFGSEHKRRHLNAQSGHLNLITFRAAWPTMAQAALVAPDGQ